MASLETVPQVNHQAGAHAGLPGTPVLSFDGVTLRFDDRAVLSNISFSVDAGQTRVIMGAAGAGKTLLLKHAIGLLCPDLGSVRLLGDEITHLNERELYPLRRHVGVLFQEGGLFDSLTVADNVAYPLRYQPDRAFSDAAILDKVREALNFVGLSRVMDKYPSEISGGMRRRVGIARAAVAKPPLMLYDSPTAGLDPITANRIMALAVRQRALARTTFLVVTHRKQDGVILARYTYDPEAGKLEPSDDVAGRTAFMILREGRLVFEGSEAELQSSTDPYVSRFAWKPA